MLECALDSRPAVERQPGCLETRTSPPSDYAVTEPARIERELRKEIADARALLDDVPPSVPLVDAIASALRLRASVVAAKHSAENERMLARIAALEDALAALLAVADGDENTTAADTVDAVVAARALLGPL